MTLKSIFLTTTLLFASMWSAFAAEVDVKVYHGFETTAPGNDALLFGATITTGDADITLNSLSLKFFNGSEKKLDNVELFAVEGTNKEYAVRTSAPVSAVKAKAVTTLKTATVLKKNTKYTLWVGAKVKTTVAFATEIAASFSNITYTENGKKNTLNVADAPECHAKVFAQQQFLFVPTSNNCRFYRIPAMIVADDGSIVAVADMRYDLNRDLDYHDIDLAVRRSVDGGKTWSDPVVFADGDGESVEAYGFGDAALAKTKSGKLICLMASGVHVFWKGMRQIYMCESTDNGVTWTKPRMITSSATFTDHLSKTKGVGIHGFFTTSGRGITTRSGRIMFLLDVLRNQGNQETNYLLYTDDDGETWHMGGNIVYGETKGVPSNEAKLVELPNGDILASVRQHGDRGFNLSHDNGETWTGEWRNHDLDGNSCNADILAYNDKLLIHSLLVNKKNRSDLRLYASTDNGKTWQEMMQIQKGLAAYSTLERLPNGDLAVFYEDACNDVNLYHLNFITLPASYIETFCK